MNPSKRDTVLDTAEYLFYEEGFHATGIDGVVAEAVAARDHDSAVAAIAERHNEWLQTRSGNGCVVLKAIGEFERYRPAVAERGREPKRELPALIGEALSIDGYQRDDALAERVMIILEGANALAPVLGSERVAARVELMLASLLGSTIDRSS